MAAMMEMDNMLTIREVSELLHAHPNTIRRWCDRGRLRAYRITPRGDRRFRQQDIADFLEKSVHQYTIRRQLAASKYWERTFPFWREQQYSDKNR